MTGASMKFLPDPIPFAALFTSPWQSPLREETRIRLMSWCDKLFPAMTVDINEWVGADPRHPLHTVVLSFPESDHPPIFVEAKVDEVSLADLVQALEV